jgi:hypothetical protein
VVSRLRQGVVHPEGRIEVGGGRETCVATSRTRVSGVLESGSQRRKLPRFSRRRTPWCVLSAAETEIGDHASCEPASPAGVSTVSSGVMFCQGEHQQWTDQNNAHKTGMTARCQE